MAEANFQLWCAQGQLSKETIFSPIAARKCVPVKQPEIYVLVAQTPLENGEVGTVLSARELQSPIKQRPIVTGMKRYSAFRPNNNRTAAKGREIVGFLGK